MKLEQVVVNAYWDTLWEMTKAGSTFATEANEVKHRVIDGESYTEIFTSIHKQPNSPFETTLKTLTLNKLRTQHHG